MRFVQIARPWATRMQITHDECNEFSGEWDDVVEQAQQYMSGYPRLRVYVGSYNDNGGRKVQITLAWRRPRSEPNKFVGEIGTCICTLPQMQAWEVALKHAEML